MLILVGIQSDDTDDDINWLASKIVNLRIFDDENGVMNKSVLDTNGEILTVSQFTLMARTKKGNRPSYIDAAPPAISVPLYEKFVTNPNDVSILLTKDENIREVTLITCTNGNKNRLILKAKELI